MVVYLLLEGVYFLLVFFVGGAVWVLCGFICCNCILCVGNVCGVRGGALMGVHLLEDLYCV
jgi:hypothetical protein